MVNISKAKFLLDDKMNRVDEGQLNLVLNQFAQSTQFPIGSPKGFSIKQHFDLLKELLHVLQKEDKEQEFSEKITTTNVVRFLLHLITYDHDYKEEIEVEVANHAACCLDHLNIFSNWCTEFLAQEFDCFTIINKLINKLFLSNDSKLEMHKFVELKDLDKVKLRFELCLSFL